jgi:hypothetical protein
LHLVEDGEQLLLELLLAQGRPVDGSVLDLASSLLEPAEFDQAVEELEVGLDALALHLREEEVRQLGSLLLSLLLLLS